LGIDTATPKDNAVAVAIFKGLGIHASGGTLNRVEDVESRFNEVWDEGFDCAARVFQGFPTGVLVNPVVDLFVIRSVEAIEGVGRTEGGGLCAKVGAAHKEHIDGVANIVVEGFEVLNADFALALKDFVDVVLPREGGDIPFFDIADAFGVCEERCGDECNVAKSRAAKGASAAIGRVFEAFDFGLDVRNICL